MNNNKKWANENCEQCGGSGVYLIDDNEYVCQCVLINKAEWEGELRSDMERETAHND